MSSSINSPQRAMRTELFRLVPASLTTGTAVQNAAGCPEGTFRCTVVKNGTGDYSINYTTAFVRTPGVFASPTLDPGAKIFVQKKTSTTSAVRLLVHDDGGTARDPTSLDVLVIGADAEDQVG